MAPAGFTEKGSPMSNFRNDIPAYAYINAQVIQDAIKDRDLARSLAKWSRHYQIPDWNLVNPGYVASLLYCLALRQNLWVNCEA